MSTVLPAQNGPSAELEQIINKIKSLSNCGGADGHLCHNDGTMIPVTVATCSPRGDIVRFGLRAPNHRSIGWSGSWRAIKHKFLNANTVLLMTPHEDYGLRLRI